jgi:hypothetical protein
MTELEAIAEVTLNAQTDAFPALTSDQVMDLVRKNMRASVWTPNTEYKVGDVVQPTVPNGHFYRRIVAGQSPTGEPVWTLKTGWTLYEERKVVWVECGDDPDGNIYNTRNAIHSAWLLKASIVAKDFDVSIEGQKWNRSQIYQNCLEMAKAWSPFD